MAIRIKPSHKGKLHRALGVPEGEPIPAAKLAAAKHSKSATVRKEATFAKNAKGWNHKNHSASAGRESRSGQFSRHGGEAYAYDWRKQK